MTIYKLHIKKIDETIDLDWDKLPANSQEAIKIYGGKQMLSDAAASVSVKKGGDKAEARALVMKKLDALYSGTIRVIDEDTPRSLAIEIAIKMTVVGQFKKNNREFDAKLARTMAIALVDRNPAYLHLAEKEIENRKQLAADLAVEDDLFAELATKPADEPEVESTAVAA